MRRGAIAVAAATGDDPANPVVTMAGGLVVGFPPGETDTVEVDYRDESLTAEPADVDDTVTSFAAQVTDDAAADAGDAPVAEAPDIGEIDWRFLDDDGTVLDEG